MFPYEMKQSYKLHIEFTRLKGNDTIGINVPIRDRALNIYFSMHRGKHHGLTIKKENEDRGDMLVRDSNLIKNNIRYKVDAIVQYNSDNYAVEVFLDGKKLLYWNGNIREVYTAGMGLRNPKFIGFVSHSNITIIHKAELKLLPNP